MSARKFLPLLMTPMLLLASCEESGQPPLAVVTPRVNTVLSKQTAQARRAEIRRQLAALCPTPLTDDELEWAAEFVEENRSKGATWIAGRLLKMHRETKVCRGLKTGGL